MPKKLSSDEKIVLIGMCRFIINSDGLVTPEELQLMDRIAAEIGFDDYRDAFNESDRVITSESDLHQKIESLKESSNKQKILKYAVQISRADSIISDEKMDILVYAADAWDVNIKSILK